MIGPLLQQVSRIGAPSGILSALDFIYAGVQGPLRPDIFRVVQDIRSGQAAEGSVRLLAQDARARESVCVSPEIQRRLRGLVGEIRRGGGVWEVRFEGIGKRLSRADFRAKAIREGIATEKLAALYLAKHFPDIGLSRLHFFRRPVFFDWHEEAKIRSYARRTPSLGELFFFRRSERDWSISELCAILEIPVKNYEYLENNRAYPSLETLQKLSTFFGVPLDDVLRLLLKTYYPRLKHPRLQVDPVFIHCGEHGDVKKLAAYQVSPGSLGEEVFFRRKRAGITLHGLAERTGLHWKRVFDFEHNRCSPNEDDARLLAAALDVGVEAITAATSRTSFIPRSQSNASRVRAASGGVNLTLLKKRPRPHVFRQMVADLEMPAEDLASRLNAIFSPKIRLERYVSYSGRPIYISNDADEARLREYAALKKQSLGEILFFARRDLSRDWTILQAANEHLHMNSINLMAIERNRRRPTDAELERFALFYGLDLDHLKRHRELSF